MKEIFCDYGYANVLFTAECNHIIHYSTISSKKDNESFQSEDRHRFHRRIPSLRRRGIRVSFGMVMDCSFYQERLQETPEKFARFVLSIAEFLQAHDFNGFAITYVEKKECTQNLDTIAIEFFRQLSEAFKSRDLLLTITATRKVLMQPDLDVKQLFEYLQSYFNTFDQCRIFFFVSFSGTLIG